jgi:hypothetical protein
MGNRTYSVFLALMNLRFPLSPVSRKLLSNAKKRRRVHSDDEGTDECVFIQMDGMFR